MSNTTVSNLNDALARAEECMRNDMGGEAHKRLESLQSLIAKIDGEVCASGERSVPEESLQKVREALDAFLGCMPSA